MMKELFLFFGVTLFLVTNAFAQEEVKTVKHENVTWNRIVKVDYKPGKMTQTKEIIAMYTQWIYLFGNFGKFIFFFIKPKLSSVAVATVYEF